MFTAYTQKPQHPRLCPAGDFCFVLYPLFHAVSALFLSVQIENLTLTMTPKINPDSPFSKGRGSATDGMAH